MSWDGNSLNFLKPLQNNDNCQVGIMGVGGMGKMEFIRKMQVKRIFLLNYKGLRNDSKDHALPPISIPSFSLSNGVSVLFKAAMHPTKRICFSAYLASDLTV